MRLYIPNARILHLFAEEIQKSIYCFPSPSFFGVFVFFYFLFLDWAAVNVLGQASSSRCGQPSVGQHYKYLSLPLRLMASGGITAAVR